MTPLEERRARMRHELQWSYGARLMARGIYFLPERSMQKVEACYSDSIESKWENDLVAKDRMVACVCGGTQPFERM